MWFAFDWLPPVVRVEVDFSADEAVEGFWFDTVTAVPVSPLKGPRGSRPSGATPSGTPRR